nr:hypothetical protein [Tanacetum cinerariifolium]
MQKRRNDVKARTTLLLALPNEHQLRFSKYETAQELWGAILKTFGGNEATKKTKKNLLKQQYGNFKAEGPETLEQTFNRLQAIVSHLEFMNVEIEQDDLNQKYLTSLAPKWLIIPAASTQVSTASADVAAANISHDTVCAYIASQSNGSQIKYEDITQIDEDDIKEIDIKWNIALLSMRADRFWKKTGKKITIQGTDVAGFDKSKVECFNCHKIGHFTRECRAPRSQDRGRREIYKQGSKEEESAPKALMAIDGIGWDWSYMANEKENHALVADDEAPTEFALMAKSSSSFKNEVFDDSFCFKSCRKNTDSLNTKITKLNEALSDSDSPKIIKTNKVETARKPPVRYAEMYRNTSKSPNVRGNWNNLKSQQLGKDFLMKNKACFKCGHFDHLAYDCGVWVEKGKNGPKNNFAHKNVTPKAVLLKTGRTPIRVNRPNMNVAQPKRTSVSKSAHSYVRRPFQRKSAVRTQFRVPMVSTVNTKFSTVDSKFSTAKSTFTAGLGNKGKAVKASACWIWRPKQNTTEKARTMLADAKLLVTFWAKAGTSSTNISGTKDAASQDACNADVTESSGNLNPTATSKNPPAEKIESLSVESAIPTFEDILGDTTNTVDTNEVEADLSNMESIILASPTPTFRIHKDHPKSQTIGPVDTPAQTRHKFKEIKKHSFIATIHYKTTPDLLQFSMQKELLQFKIQNVWILVDCSKGVRPIGTKWVLKNKKDERGIVIRNKARLVPQGHTQEEGINYEEVFAPVAKIEAIRLFLAYASFMGFTVYQMDVKSAFLYGTINEEVYVMQPPGFQDPYTIDQTLFIRKHRGDFLLVQVPIRIKWVLKNKKDEIGNVVRNKARLVTQGHTQQEGIDYDEVFAPVARTTAIRLFLAYASFMGFTVYQMDVKSAFLYGTIDEEVYVMQPLGFQDLAFPAKVYKVEKANGLHQAPRAWYGTLSKYLLKNGFQRGTIDQTLFIKRKREDFILVQVYVDDIIFGSSNLQLCREFEALMHEKFQMSTIGELNFFLGLQVLQKEDGIFLLQDKKDGTGKDVELHLYRSMIGSLMYLTASRPDIMFVVCHPKLGLWYPKASPFDLVAFSDSDYGGASQDRKSTTRGIQFLGRRLAFYDYHNMIAILEKSEHNVEFHQIVDFVEASHISPKSTGFNEFSSNIATAVVCLATNRVYNFSKLIFDGQDRENIIKTSALPHDSTPRVTSLNADEGSMQQKLQELMDLCIGLQRQQTQMATKIKGQDLEIFCLKARIKLLEDKDKGSADLSGDDAPIKRKSMEIEEVGGSSSYQFSPVAEVLTVGVPTVSGLVPTVSAIFTTASVVTPYSRRPREISAKDKVAREMKEEIARDNQRMNEQIARDAEIARIHAEKELKMMIDGLDRNNEVIARHLQEGMALEEIKEKFIPVWKQFEDFLPMASKEEGERVKRKGLKLEQWNAKKMKTSKEVSEEDLKEMMQLMHMEERDYWKIIRLGGHTVVYQFFVRRLRGISAKDKGKEKMVESDTPKKKKLQEQIDAQVAREIEEEIAREDQRMNEQLERDAKIARIHAKKELQMMIYGLDRSNKMIAKHLQEYEQSVADLTIGEKIELLNELVTYQDHHAKILKYQAQGLTLEEIREKFIPVWIQFEDFMPMDSKEEGERVKRKGLEQGSAKKIKTSEEVSEEDLKEMMQLVHVEEVYVEALQVKHLIIDWEIHSDDLQQLWALVKETLSIKHASSDKEKELWVELKRMFKPDFEDQLYTHSRLSLTLKTKSHA